MIMANRWPVTKHSTHSYVATLVRHAAILLPKFVTN